jgi:hypothetical protein
VDKVPETRKPKQRRKVCDEVDMGPRGLAPLTKEKVVSVTHQKVSQFDFEGIFGGFGTPFPQNTVKCDAGMAC